MDLEGTGEDLDNDNRVEEYEVVEVKDYYPFGMRINYGASHPNSMVNGRKHNYGFNGMELTESLDLNLYEMDLRKYDPAIARWTGIDPITHYSMSTYNAFDNNPVFWADPSGADAACNTCGEATDMYGRNRYDQNGMYIPPHERKEKTNSSNDPAVNKDEFTQKYPEKINFNNVVKKKDVKKFLDQTIEWFGFVDKFGNKSLSPGSIIDFFAEPVTKRSWGQELFDDLNAMLGGEKKNEVNLNDGNGNFVRIGYWTHIKDNVKVYSASSVTFQDDIGNNNYRIAIRSHDTGTGRPQAIIFMHFTGKNKKFYNKIYNRIKSYKYEKVKIIPHNKQ
ncbi:MULTISPECIES: RHS repeat domain-containing protein [unclassified Aquimarina]|uniref:RHS repeat domain-containing protein n=1 Tax=unclassified Aquimarina TaxID=2627091 RepID=UPI0021126DDB|nr:MULTISPECIES: RHS repeat-associated core domain-containing protein [unclassified Aquimarina]